MSASAGVLHYEDRSHDQPSRPDGIRVACDSGVSARRRRAEIGRGHSVRRAGAQSRARRRPRREARQHSYNAVASHDLVPDVDDLDDRDFAKRMRANGVGAILMIRPAAAGSDASLESIKDDVSAGTYANMRAFARELGSAGEDDIIAVVHLAIYLVGDDGVELISSGAVWLDEQSPSRDEAIERLQNLIVANVDAVRPAIREHLGMPPLDRTAATDGAAPE